MSLGAAFALGFVGLVLVSLCLWAAAAFLLKLRRWGRFLAAIVVPAVFVTLWMWVPTVMVPGALEEPGWVIFYVIISVMFGAVVGLFLVPVWYAAERVFRARFT